MSPLSQRILLAIAGCGLMMNAASADWRQFRGTLTNAVAEVDGGTVPVDWSGGKAVKWTAELPGRGLSSPIVVGNRVIVTAGSEYNQDRLHILCFNAQTGKLEWERRFWALGRSNTHPKTSNASSTPCSDGQRIFALFSSNDVICVDLDGNFQWARAVMQDFPNCSNSLGMASSPVVVDGTLVVPVENDSQSLAIGMNPETGISRWTLERPKKANWTSPAVFLLQAGKETGNSKAALVLLQSSEGIAAVQPLTGQVAWKYTEGASTIPSSVVADGVVYVPSNGTTALVPPAESGNLEKVWRADKLRPATASSLAHNGRLYLLNGAGVLTSADLKDGSQRWQLRLQGPFSGSPVIAGNHLYIFNESGIGQVVSLQDERGEIVSTHDTGETILSTPAVSQGGLFIRSDKHLWKFGE